MSKTNNSPVITYVVYDRQTGRIIHTHRSFDIEKEVYHECDPQEVMSLAYEDNFALSQVTDNDPQNLDVVMTTELPVGPSPGMASLIVEVDTGKVVQRPKLQLSTEKTDLLGDGKDKTDIDIRVINNQEELVEDYGGSVKISTSRGKLSTKGGLVIVKRGEGSITLISENATVDRVVVTAQCLEGKCQRAWLALEFI